MVFSPLYRSVQARLTAAELLLHVWQIRAPDFFFLKIGMLRFVGFWVVEVLA